jgi:aspartyl-tRNA(Asn)/glutamyl-tRNA(Gln) amidotransferase subunit A
VTKGSGVLDAARAASLNAFIAFDPADVARQQADLPSGRLRGMTIAVKDIIDATPYPTTGGVTGWERRPAGDATIVARIRAAGGVIVGKTHTNQFAYGIDGENAALGPARNPRDPALLSGGSSSGSAVAVGAGLVDAALGTDTSGSLRVPAAWCGVWALRPTTGSVPQDGVLPLAPSFDVPGPLARDLDTLVAVWQTIVADDQPLAPRPPGGLRVRVLDEGVAGCTPEVAQAIEGFVATLSDAGARIERDMTSTFLARAQAQHGGVQFPEASRSLRVILGERLDVLAPDIRERVLAGEQHAAVDYLAALEGVSALREEVVAALRETDMLLVPCAPMGPVPPGLASVDVDGGPRTVREALLSRSVLFSQVGCPVLAWPLLEPGGRPVAGVQLAAAPGADRRLLEQALGVARKI